MTPVTSTSKSGTDAPNAVRPTISAVLVTWNARKCVQECLASIRETCNVPAEVIVVDNASSDGTPELVRDEFPEYLLIQSGANLGFAKGNNLGIAQASGKYLFLVNSDVKVLPGCFERLAEFMDRHPGVGVAGPQMLGADGAVRRSTMRFPTVWNSFCRSVALDALFPRSPLFAGFLMGDFDHRTTRQVQVLNGWFWVVRREALEQVGGLDEGFFMYGEDIDWCYRFHQCGWKTVFVAEAAAVHYGGASSAAAPARFYVEMQRANVQYWKKHHSSLGRLAYVTTIWLHEITRIAGYALWYFLKPSRRNDTKAKIARSRVCLAWLADMMGHEKRNKNGGEKEL